MEKVILASDHAGFDLKSIVAHYLGDQGIPIVDFGPMDKNSVDYPDYGIKVAKAISTGEYNKGILICGTGLGMSMVANRFAGVRAALCHDLFSAMMSRKHNDSNVLVLGGRVIGDVLAIEIVKSWFETSFEGGRHQMRLDKFNLLVNHCNEGM